MIWCENDTYLSAKALQYKVIWCENVIISTVSETILYD